MLQDRVAVVEKWFQMAFVCVHPDKVEQLPDHFNKTKALAMLAEVTAFVIDQKKIFKDNPTEMEDFGYFKIKLDDAQDRVKKYLARVLKWRAACDVIEDEAKQQVAGKKHAKDPALQVYHLWLREVGPFKHLQGIQEKQNRFRE